MEVPNDINDLNNSNNSSNANDTNNAGYSFFNTKNDQAFNDNINSAIVSAKSNLATRIILAISITIVGIVLVMIIRGAVSRNVDYNATRNTSYNTIKNTIDDNKNRIDSLFKSRENLMK